MGKSVNQRNQKSHSVMIFANCTAGVPAILIRGTLAAISKSPDFKLIAVCLPERQSQLKIFLVCLLYKINISVRSLLDKYPRRKYKSLQPVNLYRCARKYRFNIITPPQGNINDPNFIAQLREQYQPTIALSFYCLQKFSPALLGIFNQAINYHNGCLPEYRGRNATSWSIYQGAKETGFAFHRMNDKLDGGSILLQRNLPVGPDFNLFDLEMEKAHSAVTYIPEILQMAFAECEGQPQKGSEFYYSRKDGIKLTTISDPSTLSKMELIKRLKAFEKLDMKLSGQWYEVTRIRELYKKFDKKDKLAFMTSDRVPMKAIHFLHLPFTLYRLYRWVNNIFQNNKQSSAKNKL